MKDSVKKILVLENDIESQGLPDIIQDMLEALPEIKHETWWWFSQDVLQNWDKCMTRFAKLPESTFLLSNPSFAGWANSLDGNIYLFERLMEMGIKIRIGIFYFNNFYWHLLKFVNDAYGDYEEKKNRQNVERLHKCLSFHEIYYASLDNLVKHDYNFFEAMERITRDMIDKYSYRENANIVVKPEGKRQFKSKVMYVHIDDSDLSKSTIAIRRPGGGFNSQRDTFLIGEITKR